MNQMFKIQEQEKTRTQKQEARDMLKRALELKARALYSTRTKTKKINEIWKAISDLDDTNRYERGVKTSLTYDYIPVILKHPNTSLELRNELLNRILQVFRDSFLMEFGKVGFPYYYESDERYLAPYNTHIWAESQFTRKMIDKILDFVMVDFPKLVDKTFQANPELADIFFRNKGERRIETETTKFS